MACLAALKPMRFTFICVPELVSAQPSGVRIRILGGSGCDRLHGKRGVCERADDNNNDINNNNGPYLYNSLCLENNFTYTQLDSKLVSNRIIGASINLKNVNNKVEMEMKT